MLTHPLHLAHPKYRPDIDGLRAIAVLSVVVFHAFPEMLTGGFIGVDVFFVISGYLISTIIFENLDQGTFSFVEFYGRRVKRIFPALLLVLIACYAVGWFVLFADEFKQLSKHIVAGAGFVSNIVLWGEAGYFDNSGETKPLLHLWSLGIEEQFYIVWPLLLWLAWTIRFNLLAIVVLAASASFYFNVKGVLVDAEATFYAPHTRFWELLSGSLLAWVTINRTRVSAAVKTAANGVFFRVLFEPLSRLSADRLSHLCGLLGLLMLLYGFWQIDKSFAFPGLWAVLPVLGSILLISAGPGAWVNRVILSNRWAVWFGLISFPLYLWHWPLLSFARIIEGEVPGAEIRLLAVLAAILLAWLTYRLVERPIRTDRNSLKKSATLLVAMILVGGIGYNAYIRNGLAFRVPKFEIVSGEIVCAKEQMVGEVCRLGNRQSDKLIVAYGDSHLNHITAQLVDTLGGEYAIDVVYSPSCFMDDQVSFKKSKSNLECNQKIGALRAMKGLKPVAVITGQRWHGYGIDDPTEIQAAIASRVKVFGMDPDRIVVLGSTADISMECEKKKMRSFNKRQTCDQPAASTQFNKDFIAVTRGMNLPDKVTFVYPFLSLCPSDVCVVNVNGVLNYSDHHHLSYVGGRGVVRQIKQVIDARPGVGTEIRDATRRTL